MPTIEVNGFSMRYRVGGVGEPVVFIHGGFANHGRMLAGWTECEWDEWHHEVAASLRLITYDRRGCNQSSCPSSGYDLATYARDIARLLEHLDVEAVHVIASSAGGPIACAFGAMFPARTRSIVFVGTSVDLFRPGGDDADLTVIKGQLRVLREQGAEAAFRARPTVVKTNFESLFMPKEYEERGELADYWAREADWAAMAARRPIEERLAYHAAELHDMAAFMRGDDREMARQVRAPSLVLHGQRDRAIPLAWGQELAATVPGARMEVIPDASHGLLWQSETALRTAIEFLKSNASPKTKVTTDPDQ